MSKKNQIAQESIEVLATELATKIEKKTIEHNYVALLETHKTKSAMVRFLSSEGFERGTIAKFMGIRYQHVRNILVTPVKKTS